ncbi:Putative F-box domain-containing protein [Septoria linicola]|uniref:F-box domain-containing protein n=1 Tax=Septoria linicola TaxID=215465 RepID=A0A9Q9B020_9PEZI|nr:putative F-box domain-containing protein [Septoria linicola]USW59197.1 Putative F-box domain-containing protein [Septoria linicola]
MSMTMDLGITRAALRDRSMNVPPTCTKATSSLPPPPPKGAEQETYSVITPRATHKKPGPAEEEEPLIDTTEKLQLKSKKTNRAKKKHEKRLKKTTAISELKSFLELPTELLDEVLSYLSPSDVIRLQRLNKSTRNYIEHNESSIAKTIIDRRYHVLSRAFQCPVPFDQLDAQTQCSLLSTGWQEIAKTHRTSYYQIVKLLDPRKVCSCTTCMLAWANLNILLDLAHFQKHLNEREPIPMIPRGTYPKWHTDLQEHNASIVEKAMSSPIYYALILQIHLATIVGTLTRTTRVGKKASHPKRLYHISPEDVESGTDAFLERSGPPALSIPYHRDLYYNLEAYVPNRGWSKEKGKWLYPKNPHENDLKWIVARFEPDRRGSV